MARNVQLQVEDGQLVIVVDLNQDFGESASGKSVVIASTGGNISIPGHEDVKVGVNVYRSLPSPDRGVGRRRGVSSRPYID